MDLSHLRKYLTTEISSRQTYLWLGLSLLISLSYSVPVLIEALSAPYMVQDDARQHVFWMERFIDPALYPNDFMADYFQSVAPWGYTQLYLGFSKLGIDPFLLNKLLPPVLALITTVYFFLTVLRLYPSPVAAFLSTTLLNQNLWLRDDVVSGTPVAFVYPLFAAFLYYLVGRSLIPYIVALVLLGQFYPQMILVAGGVLFVRLFSFQGWRPHLVPATELRFYLAGLAAIVGILIPYALESSPYGPVLSRPLAETLPALRDDGWSEFFVDHWTNFWVCGKRSGFLPPEWCDVSFSLPQVGLGLILPLLILARDRFPQANRVHGDALLIPQTLAVSFGLFWVAHQLLFRLHLPNRYGEHSIRLVMALGAGIALVIVLDRGLDILQNWVRWQPNAQAFTGLSLVALLFTVLMVNPYQMNFDDHQFPIGNYRKGLYPELYKFLANQPKDIQIASVSEEVNNLPSFTQRSVFVGGSGYVLPYHLGYYRAAQRRLAATLQAQYAPGLPALQTFIRENSIDYWLVDRSFAQPGYTHRNDVFSQFPEFKQQLIQRLRDRQIPALARVADTCLVMAIDHPKKPVQLLDAACIAQLPTPGS